MSDTIRWVEDHTRTEPILLFRVKAQCPVCGRQELEISEYLYEVPYFGKIILSTGTCRNCGYKYSDVRLAEVSEPKKIIVRVKGDRELRYLLIKSATASVYIPEKGYKMVPGPASTGFITTVEGILHRFLEALEAICRGREDDQGCRENREWIQRAIDGREQFTLVICDPEGTSKVHGEDVEETSLDEECRKIQEQP